MKANKKEKAYDSVKMMREIRDKIGTETQNMTFEEFKAYISKRLENIKVDAPCFNRVLYK